MEQSIRNELQLLSKDNPLCWVQHNFQIIPEKVPDLLAISLCPYHGIGKNGVHRKTYGKFISHIQPTRWDSQASCWHFEATGHSGRCIVGCIWYRKMPEGQHLASIEITGSQPHISTVLVHSDTGQGLYLIGFSSDPIFLGLQLFAWSWMASAVFSEDWTYVQKSGYQLGKDNPFRTLICS